METIGTRTKKIRDEKRLTQAELGNIIGVSKQAVANIESEHNKPSIDFISKLIENLDVNSNWYITGKGNMFVAPQFEEVQDELTLKVREILKQEGIIK